MPEKIQIKTVRTIFLWKNKVKLYIGGGNLILKVFLEYFVMQGISVMSIL